MSINGDKGSNYNFDIGLDVPNVQKSQFNMSYVNSFTAEESKIYPVFWQETVGGDTGTISQESLVRVINTPVIPLASRQRIFFHSYYASLGSLWARAEVFFTKGRTETDVKALKDMAVPYIWVPIECCTAGSTLDMYGLIPNFRSIPSGTTFIKVPAFKLMLHWRIWRDNYCNMRILATHFEYMNEHDNSNIDWTFLKSFLFPADDHDFRIGSRVWDDFAYNSESNGQPTISYLETIRYLMELTSYRWWTDDYFTTAQTTPVYGTEPFFASSLQGSFESLVTPSIASDITNNIGHIVSGNDSDAKDYLGFSTDYYKLSANNAMSAVGTHGLKALNTDSSKYVDVVTGESQGGYSFANGQFANKEPNGYSVSKAADFVRAMNNTMKVVGNTDITLDSLRNLACATAIMLKIAKTDGSYRERGLTFFGVKPKLAQDMRAQYIGGSYQPIIFNEVVNTADDQGAITGRGISTGKDKLGHYFADDYGYVVTLMSIMPDTYYSQGMHRSDMFEVSDDFYIPEKAQLGMEPIFNGELYYDFNSATETNKGVFGYQNRCDYMRYRYNEVHGKVADPQSESYHPYIEQRVFSSLPTLTPSFLSMQDNVDAEWRSDTSDGVSYFVQVLNSNYMTRPLPYKAEPNNLGF